MTAHLRTGPNVEVAFGHSQGDTELVLVIPGFCEVVCAFGRSAQSWRNF